MTILEALAKSSRISRADGSIELRVIERKREVPKLMYPEDGDEDAEIWRVWKVDYPDLLADDWEPDPEYPPVSP